MMTLLLSIIGCQGGGSPNAAEGTRPAQAPAAQRHAPAVAENPAIPADEAPKARAASDPGRIDAAQAIRIAEAFVHDNGYTDFEPPDARKLVPESFERFGREEWIALRRNTLRPRAVGYLEGEMRDPSGWTVGFERVKAPNSRLGRAVTMDAHGGMVRMQHREFRLTALKPRPE
jgi:hypothetical protein